MPHVNRTKFNVALVTTLAGWQPASSLIQRTSTQEPKPPATRTPMRAGPGDDRTIKGRAWAWSLF